MPETPTTWTVHQGEALIGTAKLTWHDKSMNLRGGDFEPGPAYPSVRAVFQSFAAADEDQALAQQYYKDRDALGLTVLDQAGEPVDVTVHILDFTAQVPGADIEIELYPVEG